MERPENSKKILPGGEIAWEDMAPGPKRQIMGYDDKILMVRVLFEGGAVGAVHEHFHSQAIGAVSDNPGCRVGGKREVIGAGDGFYLLPNVLRGAACLAKGERMDVFSPIRENLFDPAENES